MIGPDGDRTELAWPVGYRARFDPGLELLTADARIVGREGTLVTGGCATVERGVMSVELAKPFRTLSGGQRRRRRGHAA
jgi:hypothetical protein